MVYVISDHGLDEILDVLEQFESESVCSDWSIKLIHCELCHSDQIARLGVFCSEMNRYF
jgi:predicted amidohydrolase YtcJ